MGRPKVSPTLKGARPKSNSLPYRWEKRLIGEVERATVMRFTRFGKTALAGLLILWLFAAAFLSSGRHLHHEIHHDSEHATHQCAISLFERGEHLTSCPACEIVWIVGESIRTDCIGKPHFVHSVSFNPNSTRGPPA